MISSTIFVRVVPADKNRGYILLVGYDAKIVQRTAVQQISISVSTRAALNEAIERVRANYRPSEIRDVTHDGIKKRLAKEFGENTKPVKE